MKATLMYGAGDVRIADVPDPAIHAPADAIVRVLRAAICGSDLHPNRSMPATNQGRPMGHEFLAIIEDTGAEVTGLKRGDLVLSPFTYADNTCFWWCRRGLQTSCPHGGRAASTAWTAATRSSTPTATSQHQTARCPSAMP
jgi:threonine dehydrogenase-like Zn-dependent dehydrogenase